MKSPPPAAQRAPVPGGGAASRSGVNDQDIANAAAQLGPGVDPKLIKAFAQVESGGKSGFCPDGLPIIAFEGHRFRKNTRHIYDQTHPLLSYPFVKAAGWQWHINNKNHNKSWETLNEAMALNAEAALLATSWGMCQVMGDHYAECGYRDVFAFVEAMKAGSLGQLQAFVGYCKHKPGMVAALQSKNYARMVFLYNGDHYAENHYDRKIEQAYTKLGGSK